MTQVLLPVLQEASRNLVMLGLLIGNLRDPLGRQEINRRARVGHQDRRVSGDDDLGTLSLDQLIDDAEESQLAVRRQRRFGLVEDVETVSEKAMQRHREERLA